SKTDRALTTVGPPRFGGATFSSVGSSRSAAKTDPVTKESTLSDWEFEIIIAVVLGEKPGPGSAGGGVATEQPR
ncbi:MAG: hypothetical protein HY718_19565, partial [Planctomycetes bacterium]|nr:hypothetical protein [Planctomycetota bacterium]